MVTHGPPSDWSAKTVFTTGEAAEVCRVSQQTIIRCFDSGRLAGFRVPGSRFRRIPRDELIRFMRENIIPIERLGPGPGARVLVITAEKRVQAAVRAAVEAETSIAESARVVCASNAFDAGIEAGSDPPELVVLAFDVPGIDLIAAVRTIALMPTRPLILCSIGPSPLPSPADLRAAGASDVVRSPEDPSELGRAVARALVAKVHDNGR